MLKKNKALFELLDQLLPKLAHEEGLEEQDISQRLNQGRMVLLGNPAHHVYFDDRVLTPQKGVGAQLQLLHVRLKGAVVQNGSASA